MRAGDSRRPVSAKLNAQGDSSRGQEIWTRGDHRAASGAPSFDMSHRAAGRAALAILILVPLPAQPVAQAISPEIVLTVRPGPGPLDVTLEWTGGAPSFEVFRSADAATVCHAESSLGVTDIRSWVDLAPPSTVFYKVRSASAPEPPEICNGADDDCDGITDNNTLDCDGGACEACVTGACRILCGACDVCLDGVCQTRCGPCETCVNGACGPCDPARCQACAGGVCRNTCDGTRCLACGPDGTCVSFCDSCEICLDGICTDACDRDRCLSCQSGACRPFCDPACQTCGPQGCVDACGPCQRCVGGVCHSRCDPNACEDCIDGMCRTRCGPCETCVNGVCEPCDTGSITAPGRWRAPDRTVPRRRPPSGSTEAAGEAETRRPR